MAKRFYIVLFAAMFLILPGCGNATTVPRTATYATHAPHAPRLSKNYIYGRIAEINGDQWKINAIHGNSYAAHISSVTMYGNLFRPQHRNDFRVGDNVRVAGEFVGAAVAATAIEHAVDND